MNGQLLRNWEMLLKHSQVAKHLRNLVSGLEEGIFSYTNVPKLSFREMISIFLLYFLGIHRSLQQQFCIKVCFLILPFPCFTFSACLLMTNRLHFLELLVGAYLFFCGCYDLTFGKNHYFIYLFLQAIAFFIVGVGYVGIFVPSSQRNSCFRMTSSVCH